MSFLRCCIFSLAVIDSTPTANNKNADRYFADEYRKSSLYWSCVCSLMTDNAGSTQQVSHHCSYCCLPRLCCCWLLLLLLLLVSCWFPVAVVMVVVVLPPLLMFALSLLIAASAGLSTLTAVCVDGVAFVALWSLVWMVFVTCFHDTIISYLTSYDAPVLVLYRINQQQSYQEFFISDLFTHRCCRTSLASLRRTAYTPRRSTPMQTRSSATKKAPLS